MKYLNFKIYLCVGWGPRDTSWVYSLNLSHWRQGMPRSLRLGTRTSTLGLTEVRFFVLNCGIQGREKEENTSFLLFLARWIQEGRRCCWNDCNSSLFDAPKQLPRICSGMYVCWPGSWPVRRAQLALASLSVNRNQQKLPERKSNLRLLWRQKRTELWLFMDTHRNWVEVCFQKVLCEKQWLGF